MPNAVITGATQGIGKAITEKFLQEGFSVAVCARTQTNLDDVVADWKSRFPGQEILSKAADLSNTNDVKSFGTSIIARFKTVDILVNNAGLFFPGLLMEEPEGHLETLMATNLYSAYHLTRQLVPLMKQQQSGHVFNMCSVASLKAYPNGGAYSITKYALMGLSENLRFELRDDNIRVTSIVPGATWSRSWAASGLPEERFMKAEDIANMLWAAYSLSQQADVETLIMRPIQGDI